MADEKKSDECPNCTPEGICSSCLEKLRKSGIPEHTLEWLQLPKDKRIETVMF